jgi:hypothetical protein
MACAYLNQMYIKFSDKVAYMLFKVYANVNMISWSDI